MNSPFNTPAPKPGSDKAVRQHKAMASGMELPTPKRVVNVHQKEAETGCTYVPGFNNHKSKRGMK